MENNIIYRQYEESDFEQIHELNKLEGWNTLVQRRADTKKAWEMSRVKTVACIEDKVIGYVRGLTDGEITLYVCELLVSNDYRGLGIGSRLLQEIHKHYPNTRMDLLASSTSHTYYENSNFRKFYGFRRTFMEI